MSPLHICFILARTQVQYTPTPPKLGLELGTSYSESNVSASDRISTIHWTLSHHAAVDLHSYGQLTCDDGFQKIDDFFRAARSRRRLPKGELPVDTAFRMILQTI